MGSGGAGSRGREPALAAPAAARRGEYGTARSSPVKRSPPCTERSSYHRPRIGSGPISATRSPARWLPPRIPNRQEPSLSERLNDRAGGRLGYVGRSPRREDIRAARTPRAGGSVLPGASGLFRRVLMAFHPATLDTSGAACRNPSIIYDRRPIALATWSTRHGLGTKGKPRGTPSCPT